MSSLGGCGGPQFQMAIELVLEPLIIWRPAEQVVSLVLGWVLLIVVAVYFLIYKEMYELQLQGAHQEEIERYQR